ncbi:hypothetical protein [Clostridium perfringens]|uniref:hypothetical protein n=1 Tax=Clostridium perfringens TaxID=1502 RepID=UPI0039ECC153
MAQSIFAGCTSYEEQSLKSIIEDIECWKEYSLKINNELSERVEISKSNKFWSKVPFNFQQLIYLSINYTKEMIYDFDIILKACASDSVTEREVTLLYNIGKKAIELNREYPRDYNSDDRWQDYENKDFEVVEKMYQHGRDFFVTLMDATNASSRLRDYINKKNIVNNNISINQSGEKCQAIGINNGNIINNIYESNKIIDEIKNAIEAIEKSKDLDLECKSQVKDILEETEVAISNNDECKQNFCKKMLKIFKSGGGKKVVTTLEILSNFATIASFFGIGN